MTHEKQTWKAMLKFVDNKPLTNDEWAALSRLSLVNRKNLCFEPDNVRWAVTEAERKDNLEFYKSLRSCTKH